MTVSTNSQSLRTGLTSFAPDGAEAKSLEYRLRTDNSPINRHPHNGIYSDSLERLHLSHRADAPGDDQLSGARPPQFGCDFQRKAAHGSFRINMCIEKCAAIWL